jgi:HD-GYP domain-containing protein (c-di-GMP phosphodiesterase class II)
VNNPPEIFGSSSATAHTVFAGRIRMDEKLIERSTRMDEFEGYARPHGARIASLCDTLANQFNLASDDRSFLIQAAYLHDVGELVMQRDYIPSSRVLGSDEKLDMQRHPVIGEQEAAKLGLPRSVQLLIRWHHEWWNGSGYPDGLEGEQIPLAARILRVADTFASLTGTRPFRGAIVPDEARKYLIEWAGIEFDPRVAKVALSIELGGDGHDISVKVA